MPNLRAKASRLSVTLTAAVTCAIVLASGASPAHAACGGPAPQVLIVLDRSGSMKELVGGQSKWAIARTAINQLTSDFSGRLEFGILLFPRWPVVSNCTTGKTNVAPGPNTGSAISSLLAGSYPSGDTPSSASLNEARTYLSSIKQSGKEQYVIFITDGKETCSPNWPNTATGPLLAAGIKTYVVGFGSGVHTQSLSDAARDGGTGSYYYADNTTTLKTALNTIGAKITCCGNGVLDAGEACDSAIPAGQPGACPTSCQSTNACTVGTLSGSGCNRKCNYSAVTTIKNGDGCCPPGANSATDSDCPAACGNGVLDAGERCDTGIAFGAGACPTNCNDNNPCTVDRIVNSGCQAYCSNLNTCPTNNCGNGKLDAGEKCDTGIAAGQPGGCPTHPSHCNDNNPNTQDIVVGTGCQAYCSHTGGGTTGSCGDGKVDAGEWCDTGIPAGQPGSCPVSCNDGNACTKDVMMGSGCLAKCYNPPITQAVNGDGCCAPGATHATDSDCPSTATCGNGKLDGGETCDPAIPAGSPGACPKSCDDNDKCTVDSLGGSGCNVKCVSSPKPPSATPDGCCPKGMTSSQDPDCAPPCGPDRHENCVDPCKDIRCNDGQYCKNGLCVPWPKDPGTEKDPNTQNPPSNNPGGTGTDQVAGSGCDCNTSGAGAGGGLTLLCLGLLLVGIQRRRRRRRR